MVLRFLLVATTDLSATLKTADDQWELALIGKNVTDKLTSSNRAVANYAGGLLFGSQLQGDGPPALSAWLRRWRSPTQAGRSGCASPSVPLHRADRMLARRTRRGQARFGSALGRAYPHRRPPHPGSPLARNARLPS
jgi:hypothetical protein